MKNKKKTKEMKIERVGLSETTLMHIGILGLIIVLFFINSIQMANINKKLEEQTNVMVQISDFLQNRFEIEKPSTQMVELRELKGN